MFLTSIFHAWRSRGALDLNELRLVMVFICSKIPREWQMLCSDAGLHAEYHVHFSSETLFHSRSYRP